MYLSAYIIQQISNKWYVVENDLVGGWDISTINKTPATLTKEEQQTFPFVAECITKEIAEYIVHMHNTGLDNHDTMS